MTEKFGIVRIAKISDFGSLKASAEHTFRERKTDNADSNRTHLNHGDGPRSAQGVLSAFKKRLEKIAVARDSVLCVEYFVGASPDFFKSKTSEEVDQFFADALAEIERKHGKKNVIASDIQLDELTPHLAVYVVPVVEKLAVGTRKRSVKTTNDEFLATGNKTKIIEVANKAAENLGAKTFFGTREKMRALQDDFQANVFSKYLLTRGRKVEQTNAKHETVKQFYDDLKPKMLSAQSTISAAEDIKKEQKKRDFELNKIAVSLLKTSKELDEKSSALSAFAARLAAQEDRLIDAFYMLPGAIQTKLESLFQKKTPKTDQKSAEKHKTDLVLEPNQADFDAVDAVKARRKLDKTAQASAQELESINKVLAQQARNRLKNAAIPGFSALKNTSKSAASVSKKL